MRSGVYISVYMCMCVLGGRGGRDWSSGLHRGGALNAICQGFHSGAQSGQPLARLRSKTRRLRAAVSVVHIAVLNES